MGVPVVPLGDEIVARDGFYISRYVEDFEQLGVLGKGAFGTVFKCKKKLDGIEYAIKKTKRIVTGNKRK